MPPYDTNVMVVPLSALAFTVPAFAGPEPRSTAAAPAPPPQAATRADAATRPATATAARGRLVDVCIVFSFDKGESSAGGKAGQGLRRLSCTRDDFIGRPWWEG